MNRTWSPKLGALVVLVGAALLAMQSAGQDKKAVLEGPRIIGYDHNTVIHLFDRLGQLKPPGKDDAHPHIPEHYTFGIQPALSANAEFVAFAAIRPLLQKGLHSLDIYLWDQKANKVSFLADANTTEHEDHPSITADGNLIAFRTLDEKAHKHAGIRLFDRKAGRLVDLPNLNLETNTGIPSLCPDGKFIAFSTRTPRGDRDVFLYDRDARKLLDLPGLNTPEDEWSARVSRGGRWVAFCARKQNNAAVYLYDREKGQLVDLPNLNTKANDAECDLGPDGRFLAVVFNRSTLVLYDRQSAKVVTPGGLYHQGRIQCSPALSRE